MGGLTERNFTSGRAVDVVQGSVVDRKRRLQVTVPTVKFWGPQSFFYVCCSKQLLLISSKQTPGAHQPKGLGLHPIDKLPLIWRAMKAISQSVCLVRCPSDVYVSCPDHHASAVRLSGASPSASFVTLASAGPHHVRKRVRTRASCCMSISVTLRKRITANRPPFCRHWMRVL
jgi:hypothetical protein